MIRKIVVVAIIFCSLTFAQVLEKPLKSQPHPASTPLSTEDLEATRLDLQRMKSLVQQMQTNLAFVTTIQGPLKHQFELEIETWQLEITRMERHLDGSAEKK
jgi:hypothetical protein